MAIKIGSNFTFQGEQPNFERDRFATKADMKAFPETSIDDGHLSYCMEDKNTYQFKSSNAVDATTGKWRLFRNGFSADTISTEPNQFLAGPINTKGNIGLRKIDISDIPNLKSKYQALDLNGFQAAPKMAGVLIGYQLIIDGVAGYFRASIPSGRNEINSPDWYYATDGTLQDITTKIPKVVLDDVVSTTSDNGVKNSVITKYVDGKVTTINNNITDLHSSLESTQIDFVDLRNKVNAMPKTVFITQAAYNALTTKDANTIYYING